MLVTATENALVAQLKAKGIDREAFALEAARSPNPKGWAASGPSPNAETCDHVGLGALHD